MKDIRALRWDGRCLYRAACSSSISSADDAQRARAADAPPHIRAYMDACRRSRGLEPLWGGKPMSVADALAIVKSARTASPRAHAAAAVSAPRAAAAPAPSRRMSTAPSAPTPRVSKRQPPRTIQPLASVSPVDAHYIFAGVAAPATSEEIPTGRNRVLSRERIEPRAFAASVDAINRGHHDITLTDGHGGCVLASTADGTLRVECRPAVGLVVTARVACGYRQALLEDVLQSKAGLSCEFTAHDESVVQDAHGRSVRIVRDASLVGVALIRPEHGRPAYATRVVAIDAQADNAEREARSKAITNGMAIQLREVAAGN